MTLTQLLIAAVLVEAIWETLKMVWQKNKFSLDKLGAIFIGVLVALLVRIDIFSITGFELTVPYVGIFLTGIILSRGSNYLHDLFGVISNIFSTIK